jgi:flagellin
MALTILNNISALTAQNSLSNTQMSLQKTLTQLSTGLKINSGSDDAAGLSIANGMQANIAALTQSQQNANNGIGMLQTADGALSQVTNLLNRAVTLATEAASSNITGAQGTALNNEYVSIKAEIDQIGTNTNFNGANVFTSNNPTAFTSQQTSAASSSILTTGTNITINDASTGGTLVFKGNGTKTLNDFQASVVAAVADGTLSAHVAVTFGAGGMTVGETAGEAGISVSSTDTAVVGPMAASAPTSGNSNSVFISDGTSTTALTIDTAIPILASTGTGSLLLSDNLLSGTAAKAALREINTAITTVAGTRGTIGASVNRLQAATNVMSNQVQNLQSATNSIQNADIGKTVAAMTQYNILQSTGMAALQQANQAQQAVLKLVQ